MPPDELTPRGAERRKRLRARRKRTHRRVLITAALAGLALLLLAALGASVVGGAAVAYERLHDCTLDGKRPQLRLGENSFVYAADGSLLGMIPSEYRRQPRKYADLSQWAVKATVAVEDRRFWTHDGVDTRGVARAAWRNLQEGEIVQGASTIDQQLVRLLYLDRATTFERKRREACLALKINEVWSKEFIMQMYLNRAYYGNSAYGLEAAAKTYFSSSADRLGPAQSALLAGIIQNPSQLDPFRNPKDALKRRNQVLRAMRQMEYLTDEQYANAVARPLGLKRGRVYSVNREPYALEYVRQKLIEAYGEKAVKHGGLRVYTTIDRGFQNQARKVIRATLPYRSDPASALVSVNPQNGAIRAMVSRVPGVGPSQFQFNLAAQGERQAGSSFKTFVLVEAIRRGANPYATRYVSKPLAVPIGPNNVWRVKTYDGSSYGVSNLVQATLRSDNTVYAQMTLDLGPGNVARVARRMGIKSPLRPVPSIGLGSIEVTPVDMASAYATLASGGVYHRPFVVRRVEFPDGRVVKHHKLWGRGKATRVLPAIVAYHVTRILQENVQQGTGTRAGIGRPAAGKTGTTEDHGDAWFVGYTPQLATSVWVGYPRARTPMLSVHGIRVAGGTFPAEIWGRYNRYVHQGAPVRSFSKPKGAIDWKPLQGRFVLDNEQIKTQADKDEDEEA